MKTLREEINEKAAQFPDRWSELEKISPEEQKELGWDNAYTEGFDDGRQYERDNPVYSHRNGETEDTEVDGWYFVGRDGQWTVEQNPCQDFDGDDAKFYGPIPMPRDFTGA